jgi:hypothetical protein
MSIIAPSRGLIWLPSPLCSGSRLTQQGKPVYAPSIADCDERLLLPGPNHERLFVELFLAALELRFMLDYAGGDGVV